MKAPRHPILTMPTPLVCLNGFSRAIGGPTFWMKRDDLTPLAFGGNKLRKLEFHVAAALQAGATHLVTLGAEQSNHACQTAAAARSAGLKPVLLLRGAPSAKKRGNLFLDHVFGADIRLNQDPLPNWGEVVCQELRAAGARPFLIPYGGSNALGALGYLQAGLELAAQIRDLRFDEMLVTSSSGGTQAGLVLARRNAGLDVPLLGISVDLDALELAALVADLAKSAIERFDLAPFEAGDIAVEDGYRGGGYAILDAATRDAIHLLARTEGLITDPVYTGKMVAAAIDLAKRGRWSSKSNVLLWHTGGLPAVFAYDALL